MSFALPWIVPDQPDAALGQLNRIRDVPLARLIREDILGLILRGDLRPGDRITEPKIAARLGVSRVPVREALRDLESSGLIESRKHAGVFVRELAPQEIADLYQLRAVLDGFAGRAVASAPDPALATLLESRLAAMDAASAACDVMKYYEANLHFHWDIVSACGNRAVCDVYRGVVQQLHLTRLKNLSTDVGMLNSLREHHAIVDAIRSADPAACEALMTRHVQAAGERLKSSCAKTAAPANPTKGDAHEPKGNA